MRIKANQVGSFNVNGRVVYYFGGNKKDAEDYAFNLPIQVEEVSDSQPISQPTPMPAPPHTSGFGATSLVFILMMVFLLRRD